MPPKIAEGMMSMLATLCSPPRATKAGMSMRAAVAFSVKVSQPMLIQTARQTSQLQKTPLINAIAND